MGDLIERQAVLDIVSGYKEPLESYIGSPDDSETYAYARGLLLSIERNINALQPSVSTEKTGNWYLYEMFANGEAILECSVCHNKHEKPWNYCPNCGAKMVEPQESEVSECIKK